MMAALISLAMAGVLGLLVSACVLIHEQSVATKEATRRTFVRARQLEKGRWESDRSTRAS